MFSPFHSTAGYRTPEEVTGRTVKTKCMCTIGPASRTKAVLGKLLVAGMNVARFNASHGTLEEWQESYDNLQLASSETGITCATVLDIKGPEIRLGKFKGGGARIITGQTFTFRTNHVEGDEKQVSIMSWTLWKHLSPGDKLIVDYGLVSFTVTKVLPNVIQCTADNGNFIGDEKHVIVKLKGDHDKYFRCQMLSYRDTVDIDFATRNKFDFICAPICDVAEAAQQSGDPTAESAGCIRQAVAQLRALPGVTENKTKILLKVASRADVDMIDTILDSCDGVVLCRSLLAVHVPIEQVAPIQKIIASLCNQRMKAMVVMNHILTTMGDQEHPTRSEATDVANLVLDGVDCLVLTSPTARGQFPVKTVQMMKRICRETEIGLDYRAVYVSRRNVIIENTKGRDHARTLAAAKAILPNGGQAELLTALQKMERNDSLASSAVKLAWDVEAAAIFVFTDSGVTAHRVALYRPHCQMLALTTNPRVARQLQLVWGTFPLVLSSTDNKDSVVDHVVRLLRDNKLLKSDDMIVQLSGVLAQSWSSDYLAAIQVP